MQWSESDEVQIGRAAPASAVSTNEVLDPTCENSDVGVFTDFGKNWQRVFLPRLPNSEEFPVGPRRRYQKKDEQIDGKPTPTE